MPMHMPVYVYLYLCLYLSFPNMQHPIHVPNSCGSSKCVQNPPTSHRLQCYYGPRYEAIFRTSKPVSCFYSCFPAFYSPDSLQRYTFKIMLDVSALFSKPVTAQNKTHSPYHGLKALGHLACCCLFDPIFSCPIFLTLFPPHWLPYCSQTHQEYACIRVFSLSFA